MDTGSANDKSFAFSYLALRQTVGYLGLLLPFVLSLGALLFFETGIQSSLSSYYHTGMGDVFVGTLCVMGVFLLCYRGFDKRDHRAGVLAGVFAVGVALFPVTPDDAAAGASRLTGYVHLACAGLFFGTLTYFSLCLFTKKHRKKPPTKKKLQRNKVYKVCGYTMAICIVLIIIYYIVRSRMGSLFEEYHPVFWLESVAVVAFGISWLIKGEARLKDVG